MFWNWQDYEDVIKQYCIDNGIKYELLEKETPCISKNSVLFGHCYSNQKTNGLLNDIPAPMTLMIEKADDGVNILQTEFTKKYLS